MSAPTLPAAARARHHHQPRSAPARDRVGCAMGSRDLLARAHAGHVCVHVCGRRSRGHVRMGVGWEGGATVRPPGPR
eukprot:3940341-Rhodomonas_salina.1